MKDNKNNNPGTRSADDKVDNNAHYDDKGKITRDDERDRKNSSDDWNAEDSRTGRNK
ncbi:hypothetical protein LRS05_16755 [Flavobacterium sp. J372]|uniref:hypothetical protein n=1 Tax=Flavobacterium sp. J372 TaxID=2898436 RepID=UPI002150F709|nr:hypothetical protein [Flavobacterium sp. J372]MCR5862619.1 hypothetical protein [Flavobacterium sp. J372]MCR5863643.1 hypothetical protein [Flavobacterium sp. J372]